jgi:hypothetical protein
MDANRYRAATEAMLRVHAQDPRREGAADGEHPVELLYTRRLLAWIERLDSAPSEDLPLAAHGLHLSRWTIPRDTYPMTRQAYHDWRDRLRALHADEVEAVLRDCLYDEGTVERVRALVLRAIYPDDPESRVIEDALSLLLLERQLGEFAAKTERAKTLRVIRRVWRRMTPRAQELALSLPLTPDGARLVREALGTSE